MADDIEKLERQLQLLDHQFNATMEVWDHILASELERLKETGDTLHTRIAWVSITSG